MSPRITRSSARQAASQAAHQASSLASPSAAGTNSTSTAPVPTAQGDRKRKVSSSTSQDKPSTPVAAPHPNSGRRSKRQKISEPPSKGTSQDTLNLTLQGTRRKGKATAAMDGNEYVESPRTSAPDLVLIFLNAFTSCTCTS
jgi:E3 ubiquitin-protein ligase TRIP12